VNEPHYTASHSELRCSCGLVRNFRDEMYLLGRAPQHAAPLAVAGAL